MKKKSSRRKILNQRIKDRAARTAKEVIEDMINTAELYLEAYYERKVDDYPKKIANQTLKEAYIKYFSIVMDTELKMMDQEWKVKHIIDCYEQFENMKVENKVYWLRHLIRGEFKNGGI